MYVYVFMSCFLFCANKTHLVNVNQHHVTADPQTKSDWDCESTSVSLQLSTHPITD